MIVEFFQKAKEKKQGKKKEEDIYANGYYSLGGAILGFSFVEIWDRMNFECLDEKIEHSMITRQPIVKPKEVTIDKTLALIVSVGLMMSELFGIKGGMASGAGLLVGYTYATSLRKGEYLGQV